MKTTVINTIVGSTLAFTVAVGLALSTQAGDQAKGAQLLLRSTPANTPITTPAKMNCASCKDVAVENLTIEKGHVRTVTTATKHLCPTCGTITGVTGVGKAKKDAVNHTCAAPAGGCAVAIGF